MPSRLSRFTARIVTSAKRAVSDDPDPAVKKGGGGYADWVIVVIDGPREYLDLPYRRLLDVLHEMHGIVKKTVTADEGYDRDDRREELREANVRPVIKHRGFSPLDTAHNARHDDDTYHRRSIVEAVFFALTQRYGDTIRARTWFGQFRELVLKATVRNIELAP